MSKTESFAPELKALSVTLKALGSLDAVKRQFVLDAVVQRLGLKAVTASSDGTLSSSASCGTNASSAANIPRTGAAPNARAWLREKRPATDVQKIACLAFYLTNYQSKPHFKTSDLSSLNIDAGGAAFSNIAHAVKNATQQNKFLSPVGKGNKQITALGEDVVSALPDQEKVKVVISSSRGRRRRKGKKRKSAKA
jgi:hypothetical protein